MPKSQIGHLDASSMYNLVKHISTARFEKSAFKSYHQTYTDQLFRLRVNVIPYSLVVTNILGKGRGLNVFQKSAGAEVCCLTNVFVYISLFPHSSESFGFSYLLIR